MPRFTPPYPLFFSPSIAQMGTPVIADRPDFPPRASWFLHLESNSSGPSSATALRSFGVESQPIDDHTRRLWTRPTQLSIRTSINIRVPFFFTSGVFATARTSAVFNYFIEEFDASFRFVRGVTMPGEVVVVRQDFWWFSGSQTFTPVSSGPGWSIPNPFPGGALTATPNFFYRVWVDLTAEMRAQGFGGLGGSGAISQLAWDISEIELNFT